MIFRVIFLGIYVCLCPPQNRTKIYPGQIQASKKQINQKNRMIAFWKNPSIHYESFHDHQSSSKDLIVMAINYYQFSSMAIKYHHQFYFIAIIKCIIFPINSTIWVPIAPAFLMALMRPPSAFAVPSGQMQIRRFLFDVVLLLWVLGGWSHDLDTWLITMISKSKDDKLSPNISGTKHGGILHFWYLKLLVKWASVVLLWVEVCWETPGPKNDGPWDAFYEIFRSKKEKLFGSRPS